MEIWEKLEKIFEKYEFLICMLLIILYIILNSFCLQNFGITDYKTTIINTVFSVVLITLIISIKKVKFYGLIKVTDSKKYLYFLPLIFIISVNIWNGININNLTI